MLRSYSNPGIVFVVELVYECQLFVIEKDFKSVSKKFDNKQ